MESAVEPTVECAEPPKEIALPTVECAPSPKPKPPTYNIIYIYNPITTCYSGSLATS